MIIRYIQEGRRDWCRRVIGKFRREEVGYRWIIVSIVMFLFLKDRVMLVTTSRTASFQLLYRAYELCLQNVM